MGLENVFQKYCEDIKLKCKDFKESEKKHTKDDIIAIANDMDLVFTEDMIEWFYILGDAKFGVSCFIMGLEVFSVDEMKVCWDSWRQFDSKPASSLYESSPKKAIQCKYSLPGWIPIGHDGSSNYIGYDLAPDENGHIGQIINFGRDEKQKKILFSNSQEMLETFIDHQKEMKNWRGPGGYDEYGNKESLHPIDWMKEW